MTSTVHLLTSKEKVVVGFQGLFKKRVGRIIVGCASLASPVLHQPVEPGSPADPDSLREISPPKMFAPSFFQ